MQVRGQTNLKMLVFPVQEPSISALVCKSGKNLIIDTVIVDALCLLFSETIRFNFHESRVAPTSSTINPAVPSGLASTQYLEQPQGTNPPGLLLGYRFQFQYHHDAL
jgi:hypothetical protein